MIRAPRCITTATVAAALALSACGASDIGSPPNDTTELGDAFGSSGSGADGADGATGPLDQASSTSVGTVASTAGVGCAIAVTGDYATTMGQGSASSDHWLSDEEVADARRAAAVTSTSSVAGGTVPVVAGVAPVFNWLVISCGDPNGEGFSLLANADATASDVPFGPGTYSIVPGFLSGSEDRTQFSAIVDVGDGDRMFSLKSGTIEIIKFDSSGVAGTVEMELEQSLSAGTPKRASLVGVFEFPCGDGGRCQAT